jgi:hypothetical protein
MAMISDAVWCEEPSGLPAAARDDVEAEIRSYREDDGAEFNRVTPETRETLKRAMTRLKNFSDDLVILEKSPDYRHFNSGGDVKATSLAPHLAALGETDTVLHTAKQRLCKRSRKNWARLKLGSLCIELLEIRSWHLKIEVPTQAAEKASAPFHKFLEYCLALAEPHANKAERKKMLKEGIDLAVESFQLRKASPLHCWQWEDLFPQSEQKLFYPKGDGVLSTKLVER